MKKSATLKNIAMSLFYSLVVAVSPVKAEIPTTDDFASGADDKGGFEILFWLLEKAVQVIVLGVGAAMVVAIAKNCIQKYHDIGEGKSTWLDLGATVIGGVVLLVLVIVVLNWIGTWTS